MFFKEHRQILRDIARSGAAAIVLGLLAAASAALTADASLRAWFGLTPDHPVSISPWVLWADNTRALVPVYGAALAAASWPRARPGTDVLVGLICAANILLVAVALGAYGQELIMLSPAHYVLELLGLATSAGAYLYARRDGLDWTLAACATATILLLGAGALSEAHP